MDAAKSLGVGIGLGGIHVVGAPGDLRSMASAGTDWVGNKLGVSPEKIAAVKRGMQQSAVASPMLSWLAGAPTSDEIQHTAESYTGKFYEPETRVGDYAKTLGEFAPGAVLGPMGGASRAVAVARNIGANVALPALTSETAGQLTKGTWAEPYARTLGAFAGPAGWWAAQRRFGKPPLSTTQYPVHETAVGRDPAKRSDELLESKSAGMYDPPTKPPRPFEQDYPVSRWPEGPPADASGRLLADIEQRLLTARHVVGRRTLGGADEAFTPAEVDAIATAVTGTSPEAVTVRQIGGNAGRFAVRFDAEGDPIYNILVDRLSSGAAKDKILAHETGHAIDYFAGRTRGIPEHRLNQELRTVYNDLNNPDLAQRRAFNPNVDPAKSAILRNYGPERQGYPRAEIPRELWAEAIRAYLTNPNYIKSVAPETAKRIREYVNAHPRLSKIIQFNSFAAPLAAGAISSDMLADALMRWEPNEQ